MSHANHDYGGDMDLINQDLASQTILSPVDAFDLKFRRIVESEAKRRKTSETPR